MTHTNTTLRTVVSGDDSTTLFNLTIRPSVASEFKITHVAADGTENGEGAPVLDTDYTVDMTNFQVTWPKAGSSYSTLATGEKLVMKLNLTLDQNTDLTNQAFYPEVVEAELDRSRQIDQQQQEEIDRAVKIPEGSTTTPEDYLSTVEGYKSDAAASASAAATSATAAASSATAASTSATAAATSATASASSATAAASSATAAASSATAAAASETAASTSETAAETAQTASETAQAAAEAAQSAAETAQTGAETAETNAASSASSAATSATASASSATDSDTAKTAAETAQAAAEAAAAAAAASSAEGLYNDVVSKAFADSPIAPAGSEEGTLFRIDTSSGNVVVNLSDLATYGEDMKFAFVKTTGDANTITVNRGGTDTIQGGTSVTISEQYEVNVLIGDSATGAWVNSIQSAAVADDSISNTKLSNMSQATIKGRASGAGTGDPQDLTATQVRTILNVEDGATADQSDAEIETAYNNQVDAASQAEMEAGTETAIRRMTPQRVAQAIAALGGGGMLVARGIDRYTTNTSLTTTAPKDDTIPQSSEGTQILSVTVNVPTTTARVRMRYAGASAITGGSQPGFVAMFNGAANAIAASYLNNTVGDPQHSAFEYEYLPGASGNVTITVRVGPSSGTMYMNGNGTANRLFGGTMGASLVVDVIEP